jgi:hypothetical protein
MCLHRVCQGGGGRAGDAHPALALAAARDAEAWALKLDVEVHAEDACAGVVLHAKVDVLRDAVAKVACTRSML